MTSRRKLWLGSVLLYALFISWYTDFDGPLTEAEIQAFIVKTQDQDLGGDPSARGALLEFLRNDTGQQFLMFNAVDLAKNPPEMEGAPPDADAETLIDLYMEHMIPALLSRASHPVVVGKSVADSLDLLGIEGQRNGQTVRSCVTEVDERSSTLSATPSSTSATTSNWRALRKPLLTPSSREFISATCGYCSVCFCWRQLRSSMRAWREKVLVAIPHSVLSFQSRAV